MVCVAGVDGEDMEGAWRAESASCPRRGCTQAHDPQFVGALHPILATF
jgi:hypothetical protein